MTPELLDRYLAIARRHKVASVQFSDDGGATVAFALMPDPVAPPVEVVGSTDYDHTGVKPPDIVKMHNQRKLRREREAAAAAS